MGGHIVVDKTLVITTEPKIVCFDLPKDDSNNLKHESYSIIKNNELLAEHTIKYEVRQLCMETIFMNTENSKTSEPHKFVLNLSQRLDLRSLNKHAALQNLSIYCT